VRVLGGPSVHWVFELLAFVCFRFPSFAVGGESDGMASTVCFLQRSGFDDSNCRWAAGNSYDDGGRAKEPERRRYEQLCGGYHRERNKSRRNVENVVYTHQQKCQIFN